MMRLRKFVLFRIYGVVLLHSIAHLFEYITGLYKAQERFAKFQKKKSPDTVVSKDLKKEGIKGYF